MIAQLAIKKSDKMKGKWHSEWVPGCTLKFYIGYTFKVIKFLRERMNTFWVKYVWNYTCKQEFIIMKTWCKKQKYCTFSYVFWITWILRVKSFISIAYLKNSSKFYPVSVSLKKSNISIERQIKVYPRSVIQCKNSSAVQQNFTDVEVTC